MAERNGGQELFAICGPSLLHQFARDYAHGQETEISGRRSRRRRDHAEDVTMPQTKSVERPVMQREQILALIGAIVDVHDLCLLYVGIFC